MLNPLLLIFLSTTVFPLGDQAVPLKFTLIHTTDSLKSFSLQSFSSSYSSLVHGFVNVCPRNPDVNATFGDLFNFIYHAKASKKPNEIVLAFDTGDMTQVSRFSLFLSFAYYISLPGHGSERRNGH
jgi:hypothetical protein